MGAGQRVRDSFYVLAARSAETAIFNEVSPFSIWLRTNFSHLSPIMQILILGTHAPVPKKIVSGQNTVAMNGGGT